MYIKFQKITTKILNFFNYSSNTVAAQGFRGHDRRHANTPRAPEMFVEHTVISAVAGTNGMVPVVHRLLPALLATRIFSGLRLKDRKPPQLTHEEGGVERQFPLALVLHVSHDDYVSRDLVITQDKDVVRAQVVGIAHLRLQRFVLVGKVKAKPV